MRQRNGYRQKKNAAIAEAALSAMEELSGGSQCSDDKLLDLKSEEDFKVKYTDSYVQQQSEMASGGDLQDDIHSDGGQFTHTGSAGITHTGSAGITHTGGPGSTHSGGAGFTHTGGAGFTHSGGAGFTHSGGAGFTHTGGSGFTHSGGAGFTHSGGAGVTGNYSSNYGYNGGIDFAKYLVKKDMLAHRLQKLDERPENYVPWKETFKCVMAEISASGSEELDMMLRWTGPESHSQVQSIKVANAGNPSRALQLAWNRLDTRYGSPEKVELALKQKLSAFPRITFKDKGKLFKLSDTLSEIRSVKEKPQYAALLSFYDTAAGVNPTVSKLPVQLQNKWRDRASTYKRNHSVLFPPFTFFCDFIHDMAELINDPSFDFDTGTSSFEPRNRGPSQAQRITTSKLTVSDEGKVLKCIIHNADHSLDSCRVFRHKTLYQRRALLREHGICYRCCAYKHLRDDCHQDILCAECKSKNSHYGYAYLQKD